jgi:hypothetical protein
MMMIEISLCMPLLSSSKGGKKDSTFCSNSASHERQRKLGSRPGEAEIAGELQASYAHANRVPVHSNDSDFPTAEDGKRHLAPIIPVR